MIPEGYRMTELGPLPEEWRVVRLGEVVSLRRGTVDPAKAGYRRYVGLEHIQPGNVRLTSWGDPCSVKSAKAVFKPGDILFAKLRPYLDKAAIAESEGICSTDILVLTPGEHIDNWYFAFLAHHPFVLNHAISTTTGVNHPRTSWRALSVGLIPLPPIPEQRAIAHVLRTVQRTKEATERVIAALKELKKSLMKHLFTYGPVPLDQADQVALQDTPIGPIPAHWRVVRLGEVVHKTRQIDPRKTPNQHFKYIDVSSVSKERLAVVSCQIIHGKNAPSRARKQVEKGDVIFATVRPYLKRIAKIPPELHKQICSTAFCVLRARENVLDSEFLFYAVSTDAFVARVAEHQRGSSYPAVTDKDVLEESIPLPPISEQHEIARVLQTVDRKIEAEENRKQALDVLFKTLLHNLMTAKIRVPRTMVERFASHEEG